MWVQSICTFFLHKNYKICIEKAFEKMQFPEKLKTNQICYYLELDKYFTKKKGNRGGFRVVF